MICGNTSPKFDRYGRFGVSWNGDGSFGNRLSDFLAPTGSNNELSAIFQLDGPSVLPCKGTKRKVTAPRFTTNAGTLYDYRWVSSTHITITGTGNQVDVELTPNAVASMDYFVECEIRTPMTCGNVLVGRGRLNLKFDSGIKLFDNMSGTGSEKPQLNFLCLNRTNYFFPLVKGTTPQTSLSWTFNSSNGNAVSYFGGTNYLEVRFYSAANLTATLTATTPDNTCPVQRSYTFVGSGSCYGGFRRENPITNRSDLGTIELGNLASFADFDLYPNPATSNEVVVELPQILTSNQDIRLKISDLNGRIVYEAKIENQQTPLDIQRLVNGVYTIAITAEHFTLTKKLLVHH
ncbi:MAG: hypothetical protein RL329_3805 [Bacteroidota bacterium]|jgi:hypothetical protein